MGTCPKLGEECPFPALPLLTLAGGPQADPEGVAQQDPPRDLALLVTPLARPKAVRGRTVQCSNTGQSVTMVAWMGRAGGTGRMSP